MAKKANTSTKKVEKKETPIEKTITANIENEITNNISEIVEKIETIQPPKDVVETIMNETTENAQNIIEKELSKIEDMQKEVEDKINEVINANPGIGKMLKRTNSAFTNMWNGMLID